MMKVVTLTEGGKKIGFGHVMRCISLCEAFEERNIFPILIINADFSIGRIIRNRSFECFNWLINKEKLFSYIIDTDILIVDSYLADINLYKEISNLVKMVVYIDDDNRIDYPKGIIINGSINAENLNYSKNDKHEYFLGKNYSFLRKPFWDSNEKEINETIQTILITFGGNDMRNLTGGFLKFITKQYPHFQKNVILGDDYGARELEKIKDKNTEVFIRPNAKKIKKIMLYSDIAISACGQTLYELAKIGTPTIGVCVADNQQNNIKGWKSIGFLEYAGWYNDKSILNNILNLIEKMNCKKVRKEKLLISKSIFNTCSPTLNIVDTLLEKFVKF